MARPGVLLALSGDELGGAERNLLSVAAALPEYGFDPFVLILGEGGGAASRRAEELGLSPLYVRAGKTRDLIRSAVRLRSFPIHIIYGVGLRGAAVAQSLLWAKAGIRYVGAQRSVPSKRHCQMQRALAGRSGVIIANSHAGRDALVDVGVSPQRVHVILNGLNNVSPYRSRAEFHRRFVCVANLLPVKGHEFLLEAFEEYVKKHPEARLRLIGRDERDGEVQALVNQSDALRCAVEVVGYVKDVSAELRDADAFVLSSLREGMPTAALEAMAESVPVIATDVGGTSELVRRDETGLLVPPRDSGALFEAMLRISEDAELRHRVAEAAHQHVMAHHTFERVMEQHARVFREVLSQ